MSFNREGGPNGGRSDGTAGIGISLKGRGFTAEWELCHLMREGKEITAGRDIGGMCIRDGLIAV